MRLDRELCNDIRSKWIQALFQDLNLAGSEDTPISALSGGERKRLSLAVEVQCYVLMDILFSYSNESLFLAHKH